MKFWGLLSFVEADQLLDSARLCEDLGFDAVGLSDHIFMPERIAPHYPLSADGTPPFDIDQKWEFCDPFVALGMIAGMTQRVKLMQSIFLMALRDPMDVAKATGTLATLAPGRLHVCPAVGWMQEEYAYYKVDFTTRGKRMDEFITVLRKLWSGEIVEHHGRFFDFDALRVMPAPGDVPVIPAGGSPAVRRRAAWLGDGWMDGGGNSVAEMPALIADLNRMRREAGRDHAPCEVVHCMTEPPTPDLVRRAEDAGVTALQLVPPYFVWGRRSGYDEKRRYWEQFAETVIRHFPVTTGDRKR